jgi:hypothetical protein
MAFLVMWKFGSEPQFEPDHSPVQGSEYWLNWTDGPVQCSPFLECIEHVHTCPNAFERNTNQGSHSVHMVDVSDFLGLILFILC